MAPSIMRGLLLLAALCCLVPISLAGVLHGHAVQETDDTSHQEAACHKIAPNLANFAFSIYHQLAHQSNTSNIFFSPVSIASAFAMLSLGAKGNTHTEILEGLGFNLTELAETEIHRGFQHLLHTLNQPNHQLQLTTGNGLFINESAKLVDTFLEDVKNLYHSEAFSINFRDAEEAKKKINDYVEKGSHGKIVDLVKVLDQDTVFALVNYISFKGMWAHSFDLESTREENFYVNETTTVKVPMMFQSNTVKYLNDSVLPCQLVQLDYTGNETVFFVLPVKGKMDSVITALSRDTIQRWSKSLTIRQVDLYIPKISISGAYDLGGIMGDMGIADLLSNRTHFSGITQDALPKVSKVVHKAALQVDEKGLGAAALTRVSLSAAPEPLALRFNRPFIIMIFDDFTWSSLFLGKVVNPT
uniref:Uncharacterized protein n=1 Tax=Rangifer tarandus platyrhynchus TaxID=3082113 RepID=A0ACB0E6F3_RANTA|nr:unnamed protein product [Rangifer tarandus platyrhynchus]